MHGFLGSREDWEDVVLHLPDFECCLLDYPFQIPHEGIVVGYSMGGRIALQTAHPKILISTHPGLQSVKEKEIRWQEDQQWIQRFESEPLEKVLKDWYSQPLFKTLDISPIFARRLDQNGKRLAEILSLESLAHQNFTLPSNALFLHGEYDVKYRDLYRFLNLSSLEIPHVGHAAHLEDPQACAAAITLAVSQLA